MEPRTYDYYHLMKNGLSLLSEVPIPLPVSALVC